MLVSFFNKGWWEASVWCFWLCFCFFFNYPELLFSRIHVGLELTASISFPLTIKGTTWSFLHVLIALYLTVFRVKCEGCDTYISLEMESPNVNKQPASTTTQAKLYWPHLSTWCRQLKPDKNLRNLDRERALPIKKKQLSVAIFAYFLLTDSCKR